MSVNFSPSQTTSSVSPLLSPIKVIGVGGGGSNAVNTMFNRGIQGVDFVVCNTDAQALLASPVPNKVQLGVTLTKGRGAGSLPEVGRNAAIESMDEVLQLVGSDTSMVFITAGMGGGTGTGAAPVIARALRELNILTVGIVTIPFQFEGKRRTNQAEQGLAEIRDAVDTLLIIRNDKLRELYSDLTMRQAFANADNVLCTAAKGIAEVITLTGEINVDMNDVNTVMRNSGRAIMGSGRAAGEGRARRAVLEALESPLLNDFDIQGANFVLLNITYGTEEILMDEISEITDHIQEAAGSTAEVIWGYGEDLSLEDQISVTVIATGFEGVDMAASSPHKEARRQQVRVYMEEHGAEAEMAVAQPAAPVAAPVIEASTPRMGWTPQMAEAFTPAVAPTAAPSLDAIPRAGLAWNVGVEKRTFETIVPEAAAPAAFTAPEPVATDAPYLREEMPTEAPQMTATQEPAATEAPAPAPIGKAVPAPTPTPVAPHPAAATPEEDTFELKVVDTPLASQPTPAPRPSAPRISSDEMQARQREREERLRNLRGKMSTSLGYASLEQEPAYMRRKIVLDDVAPSNESHMSEYAISPEADENGRVHMVLTKNNAFFNDTVD